MKKILILIVSLFISITNVFAASSKFEPTITTDSEIKNNEITILIGYKGENVSDISNYIGYNKEMLTLIKIDGVEEFKVDMTDENISNRYKTFKVIAKNENIYNDANYVSLTFKLTDKFNNNKRADIYFYTYNASSDADYKFRHDGVHLSLKRDSSDYMNYVLEPIDKMSKIKQNFYDNMYIYITGAVIAFIIIIFFIIIPANNKNAKKKESVENFDIDTTSNTDDLIKFDFSDLNQEDELLDKEVSDVAFDREEETVVLDTSKNDDFTPSIDPFNTEVDTPEDIDEVVELPMKKQ